MQTMRSIILFFSFRYIQEGSGGDCVTIDIRSNGSVNASCEERYPYICVLPAGEIKKQKQKNDNNIFMCVVYTSVYI